MHLFLTLFVYALKQVIETGKTVLGDEHLLTLTSMNNLAFTWKEQGRHTNALALIKDCAQARQQVLGPEHPHTVSSLSTVTDWSRVVNDTVVCIIL